MKYTLLLFLLLPILGIAQQKKAIDGFWGIKFGSSPDEMKAAIIARGGEFNNTYSRPDTYFFNNLSFNDHAISTLVIKFFDHKFYNATLIIPGPNDDTQLFTIFKQLVNDQNAAYREGTITTDYSAPYQKGEGNEINGIKDRKINYSATWTSPNGPDQNHVMLFIDYKLTYTLSFIDGAILKLADDAEEKAETPKTKSKTKAKHIVKKH